MRCAEPDCQSDTTRLLTNRVQIERLYWCGQGGESNVRYGSLADSLRSTIPGLVSPPKADIQPDNSVPVVISTSKMELRIMRYELGDYEWSVIKPMLPNKPRGIPRVDDRRILNGIFWVLH